MVCECQPAEFTIEDLFDLLFPDDWNVTGYLSMIYQCFLDDSKDGNQSQMVISAGFYGTKDDWGKLRAAWARRLKEDGLEYFKTSEYKMLEGQFAKFRTAAYPKPTGRDKAKGIRDDLQAIFRCIPGIQGVGIAIAMDDYEKVCLRPEADGVITGDPYRRALEGVLVETVRRIRQKPGRNMVAFVHDDGSDFDKLRGYYMDFKKANPKSAKLMGGFAPLDDKLHPPLQMADMVANFTLSKGLEWLENGRIPAKLEEMKQSIDFLNAWDEHYMLIVLRDNLIRLGRSVPGDLQQLKKRTAPI